MKGHCDKPGFALAYFYFDFSDSEKQKVSNLVSSLIAQLCNKVVDLPEQLKELYKRCNNGQQKTSIRELNAALSLIMKDFEDVFIVIDALDECAKSGERGELLTLIEEIHAWSLSKIHLLVTSRPEPDIKAVLMPLVKSQAISIQGSQVESDINLHTRSQLAADPKLKKLSSEVKAEIEKTLTAGAKGM
jgi:ankyrin repeat domain-containing protein 50